MAFVYWQATPPQIGPPQIAWPSVQWDTIPTWVYVVGWALYSTRKTWWPVLLNLFKIQTGAKAEEVKRVDELKDDRVDLIKEYEAKLRELGDRNHEENLKCFERIRALEVKVTHLETENTQLRTTIELQTYHLGKLTGAPEFLAGLGRDIAKQHGLEIPPER